MNVITFQHVPNEPLGLLATIFEEKGIASEYVRLHETNEVPRTDATHFVFLGGPMSVNDEKEFPWLVQEKELIRRAVKQKTKVLGICLGAQLIASAHGANVYRYVSETGWRFLNGEPGTIFPDRFPAFQLHGETFGIPYRGRLLATGPEVRNQAFSCGSALGLQFHLELDDAIVRDWSKSLGKFTRGKIARETPRFLAESNRLCRKVAEEFIGQGLLH
ncbi:MAG TPA: type 1 glutamine amidotransferase [Methanoregula sp.]|nr:type 1 glutamine amidotransferase [Methanoregula sp.]